jgi:cupin superfamily acireductone dioxygenase involved in methionine salvage
MALVTILDEEKTITDREAIAAYLNGCGIDYEQWAPAHLVAVDASAEQILH